MKRIYSVLGIFIFIFLLASTNISSLSKDSFYLDGQKDKIELAGLKNGNYKKIVIKNADLKSIPQEVFKNKNLEYLDLSNNGIKKIDASLNDLTKLKTLNLRNNQINTFDKIGSLSNLESLDLSGNNLYRVTSITNYTKLKELNLSYNAINSIDSLTKLKRLKKLDLSRNQLIRLPKLPNNISELSLIANYLSKDSESNSRYARYIINQNKIVVKDNVTIDQVLYVMNYKEYTNQLLVSSDDKSVVEFKNYVLKIKVDDNIYTTKEFIKLYGDKEKVMFSILVDVITYNGYNYVAQGGNIYQYQGNYQRVVNNTPESMNFIAVPSIEQSKDNAKKKAQSIFTLKDNQDNYFDSELFKMLSLMICLVFLIPLILVCLVFVFLNRMNEKADRILGIR